MKLKKLKSLTGLMFLSAPVFSGVINNSQIMPPPGPYQSIMNNTPPAFVPYGSKQAQANPHNKNVMAQTFNHFPADTRSMIRPAVQPPEWVIHQQQAVKESIENMLKENIERDKKNREWIEKNNKQMRQAWQSMLDQYAKNQQQQISNAKNLPEWMKERMLKQHEQQVSMMSSKPPMAMYNHQRPMTPPSQRQRNFNQPAPSVNPSVNQNFMRPQMQLNAPPNIQPTQRYQPQQMLAPVSRMQPPIVQQRQPFMGQPYPVAPYNNYRR